MVIPEIREKLQPDTIVFDNANYDRSIIGMTFDGRAIYDYNMMLEEFAEENNCTIEEAMDWINYNTFGVLGNIKRKAPMIVQQIN